ncbi:alkaline phosphatase PhoX, partial [Acinetobacter baumannii]
AGPAALAALSKEAAAEAAKPSFTFSEVAFGVDETHQVAPGYSADVLIRWGDPVVPGAPAFDPLKQSAASQALQFGYNNDYLGFAPLPRG